jgi:hypothetical protein
VPGKCTGRFALKQSIGNHYTVNNGPLTRMFHEKPVHVPKHKAVLPVKECAQVLARLQSCGPFKLPGNKALVVLPKPQVQLVPK